MGTPLCILIVDDSRFFLELEKQFLRHSPATLIFASSGQEAISLAQEYLPSMVFMDIDMPGMDGFACCRTFKADKLIQDIPIVLVRTQTSKSDEAGARDAGADAYLAKPLDRRKFLQIGHNFLIGIDRREPRRNCRIPVDFTCCGQSYRGRCIDISSGGMFLDCQPDMAAGERLRLRFSLPDGQLTPVEVHGIIAWVNRSDDLIKQDFPLGYGVEFVDITAVVGTALRRCFGVW